MLRVHLISGQTAPGAASVMLRLAACRGAAACELLPRDLHPLLCDTNQLSCKSAAVPQQQSAAWLASTWLQPCQ